MTITLPEKLAAQMTTLLPEEEREDFATDAIADALEARRLAAETDDRILAAFRADLDPDLEPERDAAECVAIVNAALADMEAGRGLISFEEAKSRWQQQKAALLARTGDHTASPHPSRGG